VLPPLQPQVSRLEVANAPNTSQSSNMADVLFLWALRVAV
jgi:hypothetical protein